MSIKNINSNMDLENNSLLFIDGYDLNINDLKIRLLKMGLINLDCISDLKSFASLYNRILNSGDFVVISKIKNHLDQDSENPNFNCLLNKKREREQNQNEILLNSNNSNGNHK